MMMMMMRGRKFCLATMMMLAAAMTVVTVIAVATDPQTLNTDSVEISKVASSAIKTEDDHEKKVMGESERMIRSSKDIPSNVCITECTVATPCPPLSCKCIFLTRIYGYCAIIESSSS